MRGRIVLSHHSVGGFYQRFSGLCSNNECTEGYGMGSRQSAGREAVQPAHKFFVQKGLTFATETRHAEF